MHHPLRLLVITFAGLAVIGLLAGCAPGSGTGSSATEVQLTGDDNGTPVALGVGQSLVVALPSNRTTGYTWSVTAPGAPQIAQQGEPTYVQDANPGGATGVGGTETFTFKAEQAGDTTLTLAYARPFDQSQPPANTFSMPVTVK